MRHESQHRQSRSSGYCLSYLAPVLTLSLASFLTGCQESAVSASDPGEGALEQAGAVDAGVGWVPDFLEPEAKSLVVPAGHRITVRLDHAVSSGENQSGDRFTATLDEAIQVDQHTLAPAGAEVRGRLTSVDDSNRVKGRASMSLKLEKLEVDGGTYDLETNSLRFEAEGTKKKDATKIGAGAAIGAVIGAIAGGGDGAAKGAAIGAGTGTGVVLATKGDEVEFGAETRFVFTLSEEVELPIRQQ